MSDIFKGFEMNDPVFYASEPWHSDFEGDRNTGWYFWTETWADSEGPFESEDSCRKALKEYAKNL